MAALDIEVGGVKLTIKINAEEKGSFNVLITFANHSAGLCVQPDKITCCPEKGRLNFGDLQILHDEKQLYQTVYNFLKKEFEARNIHWA